MAQFIISVTIMQLLSLQLFNELIKPVPADFIIIDRLQKLATLNMGLGYRDHIVKIHTFLKVSI